VKEEASLHERDFFLALHDRLSGAEGDGLRRRARDTMVNRVEEVGMWLGRSWWRRRSTGLGRRIWGPADDASSKSLGEEATGDVGLGIGGAAQRVRGGDRWRVTGASLSLGASDALVTRW
jgi:hypothetical protein